MDPEETSYIEEIVNPSRNLFQELDEPTIMEGMFAWFYTGLVFVIDDQVFYFIRRLVN